MQSEVNGLLVAAHELKAPLSLVRQLAFSLDYAENPAELQKIQQEIIEVSDRALKQVEDLTKISRLDAQLFEMEPVAIRAVCEDVTRELKELYKVNHKSLSIRYQNRARLVVANRDLLFSVVYNFCLNALHYSEQETASTLIVRDHQHKVRLEVRDFGPALPTDLWKKLQQGWLEKPTSIAMRPGSSGLGLYIASKFSQYMHAPVGAVRHRDGTSFFIDLKSPEQARLFV